MRKWLIGSRALDFRPANDYDYLVEDPSLHRQHQQDKEYYHIPCLVAFLIKNNHSEVPLDVLYTLKFSHIFWESPQWVKHAKDIITFQDKGAQRIYPLFKELYIFWEQAFGKKKVNLNTNNELFFTNSVDRELHHDLLHTFVSYYNEPYYIKLKKDLDKAWIDKDLFEALPLEEKFKVVREETYAIALERFILPERKWRNIIPAYREAIRKLITSLSKGWFPEFIVSNLKELIQPDLDYTVRIRKYLNV